MDSKSAGNKLRKVGEALETADRIDRISILPNSLLCHILSFLPTKYAVGTCILSTRWKLLWTSIPIMDLDDSLMLHPREVNIYPSRKIATFMNFVDRVFLIRPALISRFRLKCGQYIDASRVNTWIVAALYRYIQELDLCISINGFNMLPRELFVTGTLGVLKLGTKFVLNVPIKVCLPNLKIIHLKYIVFLDDNSVRRLVSGCPVLEELDIFGCDWNNIRVFNISSPTLKRLTIYCSPEGGEYTPHQVCKYKIVIDAPNLEFLNYTDYVPEGFSAKSLQSLVNAYIYVGYDTEKLKDGTPNHNESVAEILRGISNIEFLHLSDDFMQALDLHPQMLPTFSDMIYLEFYVTKSLGWRKLPDLLHSAPLLEALVFAEGLVDDDHDTGFSCQWYPPQDVPSCLLFHLHSIEIQTFKGREEEFNMVEYFLKNGRVLQKMEMHTHLRGEKVWEISKKLLLLPRCSSKCQVEIS